MDTVRNRLIKIEGIPADRRLIEELFAAGTLSPKARDFALDYLYPAKNWGLWVSRMLLALGVTLMLSGIVYFYAFNWNAIPDMVKLGSIEFAMVACMAGALVRGLDRLSGKFFALATATLIGVFLAVFGQVYQTGADAWELFAAWALLIVPFGVAARFAPVWGLWLVVANIGLTSYWDQWHPISHQLDALLLPFLGGFNALVLIVRELLEKHLPWLSARWTRNLPAVISLTCATLPCTWLALDWHSASDEVRWSAAAGAVIISGFYAVYRLVKPDVQTLAATVLATCIIAECVLCELLDVTGRAGADMYLLLGVLTVGIFAGAIVWLRTLSKQLEVSPWLNI